MSSMDQLNDNPISPPSTDASLGVVPGSPPPSKSAKNKNKHKQKSKDHDDGADTPAGGHNDSPSSPSTTGTRKNKNKNKSAVSVDHSADGLATEEAAPATGKRSKKQRPPVDGDAVEHVPQHSTVSAANLVDVVEAADGATADNAAKKNKRKRNKKQHGTGNAPGDANAGGECQSEAGNQGTDDGGTLVEDTAATTPKRSRARSNSKPIKPTLNGDAPTDSNTATNFPVAVNTKSSKKPKVAQSSQKEHKKQATTALTPEDNLGTAAEPHWATNAKSDAEDDAQWQQGSAASGAAIAARTREPSTKQAKGPRKDARRKSGGLDAGAVGAGGDQVQVDWTRGGKSDAEDDSIWAHSSSVGDGHSVGTQTAPGSGKSPPKSTRDGATKEGHGRQRRVSTGLGGASAEHGPRQQPHPAKGSDNWRQRPSTGHHGEQHARERPDPHQPAPRRPASGKHQERQTSGDHKEGGRGRKKSGNAQDQPHDIQRQQRSGGRTRTISSNGASVDDLSVDLTALTLVPNKPEHQGGQQKLEHSPPHSPTKPPATVDIRKALGPDFGDHVKEVKEALANMEIKYADPSTWPDLYPEDVRFRPFYFQDQAIPVPGDSTILFPPPWVQTSWDEGCVPPAHPVSMFHRLSLELFAFSEHVKLSAVDEFLRSCAYARLEAMVSRLLPDGCEMFVFGSSASPLANPNSDLDVGIFPRNPDNLTLESGRRQARNILDKLFKFIIPIAAPRSVEVVFHAKVPLIKYTDRATGIEVDVSVQWEGGESVDIVYALAAKYPGLVPIVRTIKSLLSLHGLNSGRDGGIHGFCVLSMVAGFLGRLDAMGLGVSVKVTERDGKVYPAPHMHGLAFLAFLHFVGFVWDPATTGMDNTNEGALFYRHAVCDRDYQNQILLVTSVRSQATPENVGRSVRAETWVTFRSVCQQAFSRLYQTARVQMAPPAPGSAYGAPDAGSSSLLGMFLTVPPRYRTAMLVAEEAVDTFSKFNKLDNAQDFNVWVETVLSRERAYFRRKFEEVFEQLNRRGGPRYGGHQGGQQHGGGGRGGHGGGRNQPQNRPNTADTNVPRGGQPNQARNAPQGPPARGQPKPRSRKNTSEGGPTDPTVAPAASTVADESHAHPGDGNEGQGLVEDEKKSKKKKKAKKAKKDRNGEDCAAGAPVKDDNVDKVGESMEQLTLVDVDVAEN